jgi:hypothetical protein
MYIDDDEDLVKEITDNLKADRSHWARWRTEARESYDFFAGVQWSEDDSAILREQNRPVVTFNRIARTINAVAGLELQNRQEVRFLPRTLDDSGVTELLTGAAKWARDNCDAEDEESEAFQDALICGVGWTETRIDYEQDPEGMIITERVDTFEMLPDCNSKKRNFDDAKHVSRIKELPKKEYQDLLKKFGIKDDGMAPGVFWNDTEGEPHDAQNAYRYENDYSDRTSKPSTYSVVQYQWYESEDVYQVEDLDGKVTKLDKARYKKLKPMIEMHNLRAVKQPQRKYYQAWVCGNRLLNKEESPCQKGFTFRGITGLRDRNRNVWTGIVELMKDPQRWANKWLSQIQYIINTNAKGGLLAESDAFKNPRQAEDQWAESNSITWLNPGGLQKVTQKQPANYPEGLDRLLQYALQSINDVPGVNLELMGMANRDQAAVLEESRKQSGVTILAPFFDALRRYRKEQGRVLAYFIKEYIADGRLVRIAGQDGAQYVPLLKDSLTFEYDVIVDDAPSSPNMKERVFGVLNQIIPMALQAGIPIPPDVLDFAPIPEALAQKWKQAINKPNPQADQMKQMQMQMAELEGKLKESTIYLNYAKAEQAHATGQNEAALASTKMDEVAGQHAIDTHAMQLDQQRKEAEAAHSMQVKNIQAANDMQLKNADMLMTQHRKMQEAKMNATIKAQQNRA